MELVRMDRKLIHIKKADRFRRSFMAREHNCPALRVSRDCLNKKRQILAYRTWATISSSFSRHSGRRAELASTKEVNVTPNRRLHEGDARRTEQTQEILLRGTILQLLPLLLNQPRSYFVRTLPVLPNVHHPRTLVPL